MGTIFEQIKTAQKRVEHLLTITPRLRDDDNKLVSNYHYNELGAHRVAKMTATEFLKAYADGEVTNSDVITRARRKVQERNPKLRGTTYKKRQNDGNDFKNNIGEL